MFFYRVIASVSLLSIMCCTDNHEQLKRNDEEYFSFGEPSECIAIFGDIQYYTNSKYIDLYKHSLEWILHNRQSLGIKCVLHTGDITQSDNTNDEWPFFNKAMKEISNELPFISMIGDHDYHWNNSLINDRYDSNFNNNMQYPLVTNRIVSAFEEGRMENIVVRNTIYGIRYDLLVLEFGPRKEVVEWASNWVATHPDINYILMNHEYLESGGGRRITGLKCKLRLRNTTVTTPDELWDKLIRCNDNIICVLCGHVGGLFAITYDVNDFGRSVPQIQHNIQSPSYRYDNWLMLWQFPEKSDSTVVRIINTKTNEYFEGKESLFSFRFRY